MSSSSKPRRQSSFADGGDFEPTVSSSKKVRKISPLGMRIVVEILPDSDVTDAGLYLPEGAKQGMMESLRARVIEVAQAIDDSSEEEVNVSGVPLGAIVLIQKHVGVKVPWDDRLRIVDTKDVLAVVREVSVS